MDAVVGGTGEEGWKWDRKKTDDVGDSLYFGLYSRLYATHHQTMGELRL